MEFEDKNITCKDCGKEFVWSAGEQKFYADKGLQNPPGRCPDCRKTAKERKVGQKFSIICKECGKEGEVPFQPRNPDDVLCAECFAKKRAGETPQTTSDATDTSDAAVDNNPPTPTDETPATETPTNE